MKQFSPSIFQNRAFTLIEVVVLVGLIALMLGVLASLFITFQKTSSVQNTYITVAGGAGAVVNEVHALVLPADQVLASHTFSVGNYSSGTSTLVVELPSIDSSGHTISGKEDYAVVYQTASSTYRRLESDASSSRQTNTKLLTSTLGSLTFTYDNATFTQVTKVTVDVQTQSTEREQTLTSHLREQLYLRN